MKYKKSIENTENTKIHQSQNMQKKLKIKEKNTDILKNVLIFHDFVVIWINFGSQNGFFE